MKNSFINSPFFMPKTDPRGALKNPEPDIHICDYRALKVEIKLGNFRVPWYTLSWFILRKETNEWEIDLTTLESSSKGGQKISKKYKIRILTRYIFSKKKSLFCKFLLFILVSMHIFVCFCSIFPQLCLFCIEISFFGVISNNAQSGCWCTFQPNLWVFHKGAFFTKTIQMCVHRKSVFRPE